MQKQSSIMWSYIHINDLLCINSNRNDFAFRVSFRRFGLLFTAVWKNQKCYRYKRWKDLIHFIFFPFQPENYACGRVTLVRKVDVISLCDVRNSRVFFNYVRINVPNVVMRNADDMVPESRAATAAAALEVAADRHTGRTRRTDALFGCL